MADLAERKHTAGTIHELVWAVDAFGDAGLLDETLRTVRGLVATAGARVQPVFVLSADQLHLRDSEFRRLSEHYQESARRMLDELAGRSEIRHLATPRILVEARGSIRDAVTALLKHASEAGADLIIASTHGRRGVQRLLLGSFAETLLLQSKIPVLVVNPRCRAPERIERILFPTDFGEPSRKGFEAVVALASQLHASLTLYFKSQVPLAVPFPEAPNLYLYSEEESRMRTELAKAWTRWALEHGVSTEYLIDSAPGAPGDAILEQAHARRIDLIAMVAQSGPVASVLLGSVTRRVLRGAECPVWVQHSAR